MLPHSALNMALLLTWAAYLCSRLSPSSRLAYLDHALLTRIHHNVFFTASWRTALAGSAKQYAACSVAGKMRFMQHILLKFTRRNVSCLHHYIPGKRLPPYTLPRPRPTKTRTATCMVYTAYLVAGKHRHIAHATGGYGITYHPTRLPDVGRWTGVSQRTLLGHQKETLRNIGT